MKEEHEEKLIRDMVDALRDHSEPYKEGAWEGFLAHEQQSKRPVRPLWPWLSSVAAVLLAGIAFYIFYTPSEAPVKENPVVVNQEPKPEAPGIREDVAIVPPSEVETESWSPQAVNKVSHRGALLANLTPAKLSGYQRTYSTVLRPTTLSVPAARKAIISAEEEVESVIRKKQEPLLYTYDDLSDEKSSAETEKIKSWDVGVLISPAVTNVDRVNMGGGVRVAYNINKKLSVGSGISVMDLGLRQNADVAPPVAASPASLPNAAYGGALLAMRSPEQRELVSVQTNLFALDVPVEFRYRISERFYASAGVSVLAGLKENRVNNYLVTDNSMRSLDFAGEGFTQNSRTGQLFELSETAPQGPYEGNSYSGFLNFSVGHQWPLSRKVGLSLEPYVKLPVGRLSRQDMDLRHGGLRVITSF